MATVPVAAASSAESAVAWKRMIATSLKKNKDLPYSRYVQIATVRENGRPANRTVVFRGFLWDTEKLTFVTDTRSSKVAEVAGNPWCEMSWYFPRSREQYRIQGSLSVIQKNHADERLAKARVTAWKNMSDGGRTQFAWPHPGIPRPEPEDTSPYDLPPLTEADPVSDNFALVVLHPLEVDYLSLKGNSRKQFQRISEGGAEAHSGASWSEVEINP